VSGRSAATYTVAGVFSLATLETAETSVRRILAVAARSWCQRLAAGHPRGLALTPARTMRCSGTGSRPGVCRRRAARSWSMGPRPGSLPGPGPVLAGAGPIPAAVGPQSLRPGGRGTAAGNAAGAQQHSHLARRGASPSGRVVHRVTLIASTTHACVLVAAREAGGSSAGALHGHAHSPPTCRCSFKQAAEMRALARFCQIVAEGGWPAGRCARDTRAAGAVGQATGRFGGFRGAERGRADSSGYWRCDR